MKPIVAKENFNINNGETYYFKGDTITEKIPFKTLVILNEKGYIEPLSIKDLIEYSKPTKKEVK